MKYSVITFGCRVNQADSLGFEEELRSAGAQAAGAHEADVVIVNTCSVTASADQSARQTIRRLARDNPAARIVVTGCYATRRPDEAGALPNVVRVVANDDKPRLLSLLRPATAERFGDGDGPCGAPLEPGIAGRTSFTLRVQTGCAEPCSYCIIPSTRGTPRSVAVGAVLREIDRVESAGFKEIVLTGVHLGSYGRDLAPAASLLDLLRAIAGRSTESQMRFRISSLEPMDCTPGVVRAVAEHDCFAPHFHLPLQHASDGVLRAMRRPYTLARYSTLVDDIRARIPGASIGSDIIVGFPGECDDDLEKLATYLEGSPLTHLHVFPYSDRPGTDASRMVEKVPGAMVRLRAQRIRAIGARLQKRFNDAQVGTVHRALAIDDGETVVTGNYLKLRIAAGHQRNDWVLVRVRSEHEGEALSGGFLLAVDDQLSARGPDVASAAFPD